MISLYILVLVILIICSCIEIRKYPHMQMFGFLSYMLIAMCTFRYGQGTDYINYELQYRLCTDDILTNYITVHDWFFTVLFTIGYNLNIPFYWLPSVIGFISSYWMIKFIKKYSPYPIVSLLIYYSIYQIIYHYSAIRQGLALSFFCFYMVPLLVNGMSHKKYYFYVVVVTLIHGSAIITALFPFLLLLKQIKSKRIIIGVFLLCSLVNIVNWENLGLLGLRFHSYIEEDGNNMYYPILTRAFSFFYPYLLIKEKFSAKNKNICILFFSFFIVFLALCQSPTLAARLCVYQQIISIIVWPMALERSSYNIRFARLSLLILFLIVMFVKNINSEIENGHYYNKITTIEYPYISVFEKESIGQYRPLND